MTQRAIRFYETGGPEVLQVETVSVGEPGPGEVRVTHRAIGLNFIDTYHRSGLYPVPLPSGLGLEASGVVEAVGPGVTRFAVGDRVAFGSGALGAYATASLRSEAQLLPIPDGVDDETAAAIMLKGMTAAYLLTQTRVLTAQDTILLHAAAGGTGLLMLQWAKDVGARVIGVVGSEEKAELVARYGCDHILLRGRDDIPEQVRALTDGRGVPVVYDSVGRATFEASLNSLAPRGLFVSFGNASGPAPDVTPAVLAAKGSLFFTRPTLASYAQTREELEGLASAVFERVARGALTVEIHQRYALEAAAEAHRHLESGTTQGATILKP
jgi:NADPH2:quinone reductase